MSEVYLGNPNLKKANTAIEFTEDNIIEFMKCKEDPVYFANNYIKIVSLDHGLVPFNLYPFQEKLIQNFHDKRFNICKMPRQTGKSTTCVSYLLHYAVFNDNVNIAILANKASTARDLLGRLQLAYENLPKWMQQGIISWNKGSLELENGSKISANSTSSSAVRGGSYNVIFLDEFAFIPNHIADDFFASVYPTISSGQSTKVIIVSTPRGMNHFYRMWHDSQRGKNEYIPTDVHWSEVPGRDDVWKEQTIANTSEQQFKIDIRKHIQDIAEKYIITGETSEGAIMFIPAEAIFAEIHSNHPDLVLLSHQQHVWLASPSTLMAILTTASAVLKDDATKKQVHVVQEHLNLLAKDFARFERRMQNLSRHINQANQDVDEIHTSTKKITNRFSKIEQLDIKLNDLDDPSLLAEPVEEIT